MFEEYFREELQELARALEESIQDLLIELDKNVSGDLIESIQVLVTDDNNLELVFLDYGEVVDQGLRGTRNRTSSFRGVPPFRNTISRPFAPGPAISGTPTIVREGEVIVRASDIFRWVQARGLTPRGNIGTQENLAWALSRSIRERGFAPTNWIEESIDSDILEEMIGEAHALATERVLDDALQNNT